jgi:hypothetical protein
MFAITSPKGWYSTIGIWLDNPEYADYYRDKLSATVARDHVLRDPDLMDGLKEAEVVIDHAPTPPLQVGTFLLTNDYGVYSKSGGWTWEEKDFAGFTQRSHAAYMLERLVKDPSLPEWHKSGLRVTHIGEFHGGTPEDWDADHEHHKLN